MFMVIMFMVLMFRGRETVSAGGSGILQPPMNYVLGGRNFDVPDFVYREGNGLEGQDVHEVTSVPRSVSFDESILCSSDVIVNERFLRGKGMQSVTLNQGSPIFHCFSSNAEFLKFHANLTNISRLHTQIVQRK
ncbi:MAG: hypothetical protein LBJ36_10075 [Synergistaceae bacterium]|nr:hypothetical protein [Synergistaceae bacterium]